MLARYVKRDDQESFREELIARLKELKPLHSLEELEIEKVIEEDFTAAFLGRNNPLWRQVMWDDDYYHLLFNDVIYVFKFR